MKNIDIEKFYRKIKGHLKLLTAYTDNPTLPKIIRSCRLKPHSIFEDGFEFTTKLENHWVDEFGNSLYLTSSSMQLKLGDLSVNKNARNCTDLFYGNSINVTGKNSKFALIAAGTELLSDNDFYLVSFYGIDEYIRAFIFTPPVWTRVSPLMMGTNTLEKFFSSINNKWVQEVDKKDLDFVIPFNMKKCITTSWPTKQDIMSCFNNSKLIDNIRNDE